MRAKGIAEEKVWRDEVAPIPSSRIHDGILQTLTDFANNVTRYSNINLLVGIGEQGSKDAIEEWYRTVTQPILGRHYPTGRRNRDARNAALMANILNDCSYTSFHDELGARISSAEEASIRLAMSSFAKRYERLYVLQILRFLGALLSDLGGGASKRQLEDIPSISDFFRIFYHSDDLFLRRSTWSVYGP